MVLASVASFNYLRFELEAARLFHVFHTVSFISYTTILMWIILLE